MGVEIELKYKATAPLQEAVGQAFPGKLHTLTMQTEYYDTLSGALSARRYTLRRRLENGVPVCTVKAPAAVGRGEWEVQCESILQALPLLIESGAPKDLEALCAEGIHIICGAAFTRECRLVTAGNLTVELAFDRGILTGGGRTEPLCEIEAELKRGSEADLTAFGESLERRFGLVPEHRSKFRRALALSKGEAL